MITRPKIQSSGFTLLEVVIAIAILAIMVTALSTMLKNGFDLRFALSQNAKVTNRLNNAMRQISEDLSKAFVLSGKDVIRNPPERATKTLFEILKESKGDKLRLTTMNHKASRANARESSLSFVVYEVKEAKDVPGRTHLYRGEDIFIPEDNRKDPDMVVIAKNIKSISFETWNGDGWTKDRWSTKRRDTRDKLPHMVRVVIEAYEEDRQEEDREDRYSEVTTSFETVVFLPFAAKMPELKEQTSTMKL